MLRTAATNLSSRVARRQMCAAAASLVETQHPHRVLNQRVQGLGRSATLAINERSNELLAQDRRVFKLGLGQSPFPVPDCVQQALRENAHQKDYLPVDGLRPLQEAISTYHNTFMGRQSTAEDILVGPGSKELLFLMQLCYYGQLLLPNPSWVSYGPQAQIVGRPMHWLPTFADDNWVLQADVLEQECKAHPDRARILLLNYPSNPTGASPTKEELQALADVARRYKVLVLSDEIYGEVTFKGEHHSISEFYPEGTIVSGGISKWAGAGGWRLGVYNFPKSLTWLREAMAVVASETFTSVSAPIQWASIRAYQRDDEMNSYLRRSCRVLECLGVHVTRQLRDAGVDIVEPRGGFYAFPDFQPHAAALKKRHIRTSPDLASALLEDVGVAGLPGSNFGRPVTELSMRFSFVNFDGAAAIDAIDDAVPAAAAPDSAVAEEFVHKYCAETVEAFEEVKRWCRSL